MPCNLNVKKNKAATHNLISMLTLVKISGMKNTLINIQKFIKNW